MKPIIPKTAGVKFRTPKVKDFVYSPFITCPDCGEDKFGVLMICGRHYVRRCINCWFDKSFPLPTIQKKIIYLDQFVISNMMKELDPDRPKSQKGGNGGFYRTVFETLDRLSKLQLIVCPDSPLQNRESAVDSRYEKIRAVFRHLSHGLGFLDSEAIFYAQMFKAFVAWLNGEAGLAQVDPQFALQGNPYIWQERYRIEIRSSLVPGLITELKDLHLRRTAHLHETCTQWTKDRNFNFRTVFDEELNGFGRRIFREFFAFVTRYAAAERGELPFDRSMCFWPEPVNLMTDMLSAVAPIAPEKEEQFNRIKQFFGSPNFRAVPFARISALFWASLARDVNAGRKPENFPGASMYTDIDAVAAYSSFCDAMFVDKEISHLAAQSELKKEFAGKTRLFSLRKSERSAFIEYLAAIEEDAPKEHLELVKNVYGENWGSPFMDLLSVK